MAEPVDAGDTVPGRLHVLVADESAVSRSFLSRVVSESFRDDPDLVECSDTARAIELMTPDIELLLVDQQLPEGGAWELLRRTRDHGALKVVTTLYSDDDRLFDLIRLGAAGYLLKEDRFEVQVEQLQRIAHGQPPMSPAIARSALAAFGSSDRRGSGAGLEPEEADVLNRISRGYTMREVAGSLSLSVPSIAGHIAAIYRKLQAGRG